MEDDIESQREQFLREMRGLPDGWEFNGFNGGLESWVHFGLNVEAAFSSFGSSSAGEWRAREIEGDWWSQAYGDLRFAVGEELLRQLRSEADADAVGEALERDRRLAQGGSK